MGESTNCVRTCISEFVRVRFALIKWLPEALSKHKVHEELAQHWKLEERLVALRGSRR